MKSGTTKTLALVLVCCLAACGHEKGFKKSSPAVAAATNMQLAIEYLRLGEMIKSRDTIERALGQDPGNPDVQMTAGLIYERLNEMPKADRAYAAGYRLGKGDPNTQNNYAGYLCRTGKAIEGEKLFLQVASSPLYRTPEVALVYAGVCSRGTGDVLDAERYFNKALAIRPNMPEALLQLGNIAFDRGDAEQSREIVKRYLAVNLPTAEVLWLGFRAERKLGDTVAAAGYARRVQSEYPDLQQAQMMRSGVDR